MRKKLPLLLAKVPLPDGNSVVATEVAVGRLVPGCRRTTRLAKVQRRRHVNSVDSLGTCRAFPDGMAVASGPTTCWLPKGRDASTGFQAADSTRRRSLRVCIQPQLGHDLRRLLADAEHDRVPAQSIDAVNPDER